MILAVKRTCFAKAVSEPLVETIFVAVDKFPDVSVHRLAPVRCVDWAVPTYIIPRVEIRRKLLDGVFRAGTGTPWI